MKLAHRGVGEAVESERSGAGAALVEREMILLRAAERASERVSCRRAALRTLSLRLLLQPKRDT